MVKDVYLEQVCLKGIKSSKKGMNRYKTLNEKVVLQFPEDSMEVIQKSFAED
jgi:hypothetical protein